MCWDGEYTYEDQSDRDKKADFSEIWKQGWSVTGMF